MSNNMCWASYAYLISIHVHRTRIDWNIGWFHVKLSSHLIWSASRFFSYSLARRDDCNSFQRHAMRALRKNSANKISVCRIMISFRISHFAISKGSTFIIGVLHESTNDREPFVCMCVCVCVLCERQCRHYFREHELNVGRQNLNIMHHDAIWLKF